MKKSFSLFFLAANLSLAFSQIVADYAVQLSATVVNSPSPISIQWTADPNATLYRIYRKLKSAASWTLYDSVPGNINQWTDGNVTSQVSYEYKFQKVTSSYTGYGYINSGIEIQETECRGKLILIIDSAYKSFLSPELKRMEQDLTGDGWIVLRHEVNRNDVVSSIKNLILADYNADPQNTKAVFLFGRIPIPYSGNLNPDGHPEHKGAWPADVFYGDMDGNWTDVAVNTTSATDPRNHNIPGDGKFDQSAIPSDIELQVGRVDFFNLPSFSQSEDALLKKYLDKNHDYRQKNFSALPRALIDDNFGILSGCAPAANGWRNFSPLVGTSNVSADDYITSMDTGSYLWSYGCGPGSPTSCSGVANTSDFAADSLRSIFTLLFGSYFGDWDYADDLMRAALASGSTLTVAWTGFPNWQLHHLAMGENMGYAALLSQNNSYFYLPASCNGGNRGVHIALLGDPTLRQHIVAPPKNLSAATSLSTVQLNWNGSADAVLGYHVYRLDTISGCYMRLNASPVAGLSYTDANPLNGINDYMVRAVKPETGSSGSYYNLSQGIFDTAQVILGENEYENNMSLLIYPNPSSGEFKIQSSGFKVQSLEIYNILGEKLYSYVASHQSSITSGNGQLTTDNGLLTINLDVPNGMYFIKVSDGFFSIIKKLNKQ